VGRNQKDTVTGALPRGPDCISGGHGGLTNAALPNEKCETRHRMILRLVRKSLPATSLRYTAIRLRRLRPSPGQQANPLHPGAPRDVDGIGDKFKIHVVVALDESNSLHTAGKACP